MSVCGIVLAAGAGTRYGGPKALARDASGEPWIGRAVEALRRGGCAPILVALGASAAEARDLVPHDATPVIVPDWADGLSATLRATLAAAGGTEASAALLIPVDTPDLPAAVVARLAAGTEDGGADDAGADTAPDDSVLRRAVYDGAPGHPVVIGRRHWGDLAATLTGDRGAGAYLSAHGAERVECADLWDGADVDERVG